MRKKLVDEASRQRARAIRDRQWSFMERLAREGTVHVCTWNKYRQEERRDELRLCLLSGNELLGRIDAHRDWFVIGPQNQERWTNPVSLSDAGRIALDNRHRYDLEPVRGGLVEPGWEAIPALATAEGEGICL